MINQSLVTKSAALFQFSNMVKTDDEGEIRIFEALILSA